MTYAVKTWCTIVVPISAAPRSVHSKNYAVVNVKLMSDNCVCTKHLATNPTGSSTCRDMAAQESITGWQTYTILNMSTYTAVVFAMQMAQTF